MAVELTVVISICCALMGSLLGYLTFQRNQHKDIEAEAKSDGVILTEIGYVKAGIDDIKRKQESQDARFLEMAERMTRVEASAKQAHKRLDAMEGA